MIKQLREFYTPEQRALIYDHQFDHTRWEAHVERVERTAQLLREMDPCCVADLSCGDGAIVKAAGQLDYAWMGDLTPEWDFTGPIEETINRAPWVDVFLLSETLEHVENPGQLLKDIRKTASRLLLSTPCGEWNDYNPEHYWGWDTDGVHSLLSDAGWSGEYELFTPKASSYYTFQIWTCE